MTYIGFNARNVTPASSFDLLPKGKYLAICIDSEVKTNQARTGEYLKLTFEVVEGQYKGRKVFDQINIRHQNAKAVEIAHGILSQLCHAVGVLDLQDSNQLHNLPLYIGVGVEKGTNGYDDKNRIYSYHSLKELPAPPVQNTALGTSVGGFTRTTEHSQVSPTNPWGTPPPLADRRGGSYTPATGIKDDDVPF